MYRNWPMSSAHIPTIPFFSTFPHVEECRDIVHLSGHQPQASAGAGSICRREECHGVQPEDGTKPSKLSGPGRLLPSTQERRDDAKPPKQFDPGREPRAGHALQLAALVAPRPTPVEPSKLIGGGRDSQQEPQEQPGPVDRLEDVAHVREREPRLEPEPPPLFDTQLFEEPAGERDEHGAGRSQPPEEPERIHCLRMLESEPEKLHRAGLREIVAGEHRRERGGAQRIDRGQRGGGEEPASRHRSRARDRQDAEGQPERIAGEERHEGEPDSAGSEERLGRSRCVYENFSYRRNGGWNFRVHVSYLFLLWKDRWKMNRAVGCQRWIFHFRVRFWISIVNWGGEREFHPA